MLLLARFVRVVVLAGMLSGTAYAQLVIPIDSLPPTGLLLRTGWRWHPGNNPAWASPTFNDRRWDTIRPNRSIARQPDFQKSPQGWFRLTFTLDSTRAKTQLAFVISQLGASEIYLDGILRHRLGKVGLNYQQQQAYSPTFQDAYLLPPLSAGRHVVAVRLSQHRPPWYTPKFLYFSQSVFGLTLFPANKLTNWIASQVYIQALGNYVLVGIFLMLGVIHFMYYRYRRKRVNLIFGLTMLFGTCCVILIECVGLVNRPSVAEWLFLGQGMFVFLFMWFLLVTYYGYLGQSASWQLGAVAILLLIPRIAAEFIEPTIVINIASLIAIIALFADGIRISVVAIRARRVNARFMLISIVVMVVILVVGAGISWWLQSRYPAYSDYAIAVTNMLFFLSLPINFAVILARDYAQTNRDLQNQLGEVQRLSIEKQQLLARQNEILEYQVKQRTEELTQSLTNLRDTQQQLVLREKMASLGELTAGIAHEIQNPLHFVNNFAEVSVELVEELRVEQEKGNKRDEALEAEILTDLGQNLEKISQHGGRASGIVRGMLEHARPSAGEREPTDLNALTDEYLKLAYHGVQAKDNAFDAQLVTHFDPNSSPVTVVPQELGRVLLNLFNNAFYATQERATQERAVLKNQQTGVTPYQPTVTVQTKQLPDTVEISVSDNGSGIPEAIREKVFNPFFTTKPTGQGTGLGLSLSYDLITKGHNGTLTFETTIDEGTTFTIRLPVATNQS